MSMNPAMGAIFLMVRPCVFLTISAVGLDVPLLPTTITNNQC